MKTYRRRSIVKSMLPMLIMFLILTAASIIASLRVEYATETNCTDRLSESVEQSAKDILVVVQSDTQRMSNIAGMLADHTDLNKDSLKTYLNSVKRGVLVSNYSILTSDNEMLFPDGQEIELTEGFDFEEENFGGLRLSDRFSAADGEEYIAFTTPIIKDAETVGVLFGYLKLSDMPSSLDFVAFDSQCELYVVDGDTGDFLVDTWHDTLGNINDDSLKTRTIIEGSSFEEIREDLEKGRSGFCVFKSETTGEDFYSYYYPIGAYNLTFMVTVSRGVAFASADQVQATILWLFIVEAIATLGLVVYLIVYTKSRLRHRHFALVRTETINEVQQLLFDAYRDPSVIDQAIAVTAEKLGASSVRFIVLHSNAVERSFGWPEASEDFNSKKIQAKELMEISAEKAENSALYDKRDRAEISKIEKLFGIEPPIDCFAVTRIVSTKTGSVGILYAVNPDEPRESIKVLEALAVAYQMALRSSGSFNKMQIMGERDSLTKLKNRNAYQNELSYYHASDDGLCCIYIDANGLHDLNNTYGHAAGDEFLKTVGTTIGELFGYDNSYRIGGDEFVVFVDKANRDEVETNVKTLLTELAERDYYVSVGTAFKHSQDKLAEIILTAEERMYEDKNRFYSGSRDRRKARSPKRDKELENKLAEKSVQDEFLAAISAEFLGVYMVNLTTDEVSIVYKPKYFEEMLKKHSYHFRDSLYEYAETFVDKPDREAFAALFNYDSIDISIRVGQAFELSYGKTDGSRARVRILPTQDYCAAKKTTMWIFENEHKDE